MIVELRSLCGMTPWSGGLDGYLSVCVQGMCSGYVVIVSLPVKINLLCFSAKLASREEINFLSLTGK